MQACKCHSLNHFLGSGDSGSRSRYFAVDGRWYVCVLSWVPTDEIQLQGQGCLFPAHRSAVPAVVVHAHAAVIDILSILRHMHTNNMLQFNLYTKNLSQIFWAGSQKFSQSLAAHGVRSLIAIWLDPRSTGDPGCNFEKCVHAGVLHVCH